MDSVKESLAKIAERTAAAMLPAVDSGDNGKILAVASGAWAAADAPSGLPAVSAADNGDVLTVVEGSWAKAAPSGGGTPLIFQMQGEYPNTKSNLTVSQVKAAVLAGTPIYELYENPEEGSATYGAFTEYQEITNDGVLTAWVSFKNNQYVTEQGVSDPHFIYMD